MRRPRAREAVHRRREQPARDTPIPQLGPDPERPEEADRAPARRKVRAERAVPSSSAANVPSRSARQRVRTQSESPAKRDGSGSPMNVPNAWRKMRSASSRSHSSSGRTVTSIEVPSYQGVEVGVGVGAQSGRRAQRRRRCGRLAAVAQAQVVAATSGDADDQDARGTDCEQVSSDEAAWRREARAHHERRPYGRRGGPSRCRTSLVVVSFGLTGRSATPGPRIGRRTPSAVTDVVSIRRSRRRTPRRARCAKAPRVDGRYAARWSARCTCSAPTI